MIIPWLTRALLSTVLHSVCGMEFTKLTMSAVVNILKGKKIGSDCHLRSRKFSAEVSDLGLKKDPPFLEDSRYFVIIFINNLWLL